LSTNPTNPQDLHQFANCIRFLAIDAVQKANSGHPGMPMGMADIATVLFKDHLKFDPNNPQWLDRDRLIISNGHGSMLLYASLYLTGYKGITLNDIKEFRQIGSPTAGHPEYGEIAGIETTTGPLSQGLANGVGFALAEKILQSKFGKNFINHYTYVFAGDGCLMEGLSHESCSLAGHLNLSKLIVLFDENSISIDGPTNLSVSDNTIKRFESYGWKTLSINGHNHKEISKAITIAKNHNCPTLIACKTKIGFGSPNKESTSSSHGSPLGEDEVKLTRKNLKWQHKPFEIPNDLLDGWRTFYKRNNDDIYDWKKVFKKISNTLDFKNYFSFTIPSETKKLIKEFKSKHFKDKTNCATRKASEKSIEILSKNIDNLIGGSADLTGSNNTKTKYSTIVKPSNFKGNYIHYGVREHAMAGIMNGMALHGGILPYGGTFLIFLDYCKPALRLSAFMGLRVIYIFSHDSIGLGEDGPTHQPIEHLTHLRAIPNLNVFRPADTIETLECWEIALKSSTNPSVIALSRQKIPFVTETLTNKNMSSLGGYELKKTNSNPEITLIASGSEVQIAIEALIRLKETNINSKVVSMPCQELFDKQSKEYREKVIEKDSKKISIEASSIFGWEKYVGSEGSSLGIKSFGKSAPYKAIYEDFNLTSNSVVMIA